MAKIVKFDSDARSRMIRGIDTLANTVKITLGQKGRNVVIDKKFGAPAVTKDGVSVAKEIELEDALENMGAQMVKEVASKTNDLAGDGTTTATVLAQAIVAEGLKNVAAGANPMDLKRGIDKAVEALTKDLAKQSKEVGNSSEKIKQVASISANNDAELRGASLLRNGALAKVVDTVATDIATTLAKVEAGIDFVDEEDVVTIDPQVLQKCVESCILSSVHICLRS